MESLDWYITSLLIFCEFPLVLAIVHHPHPHGPPSCCTLVVPLGDSRAASLGNHLWAIRSLDSRCQLPSHEATRVESSMDFRTFSFFDLLLHHRPRSTSQSYLMNLQASDWPCQMEKNIKEPTLVNVNSSYYRHGLLGRNVEYLWDTVFENPFKLIFFLTNVFSDFWGCLPVSSRVPVNPVLQSDLSLVKDTSCVDKLSQRGDSRLMGLMWTALMSYISCKVISTWVEIRVPVALISTHLAPEQYHHLHAYQRSTPGCWLSR